MKNTILKQVFRTAILAIFIAILLGTKGVWAQYYSEGEQKNRITVDKKIRYIYDSSFYDNIDSSVRIFSDGDIVEFQIKIENNSGEKIENITVSDILPSNLTLIFFPGTFNKDEGKITWKIDKLEKGEYRNYYIRAKVVGVMESKYKYNKMVNFAEAVSGNISDSDNASYFVAKKMVPITGPEDIIVQTLVVTVTALGALKLRKLARGY